MDEGRPGAGPAGVIVGSPEGGNPMHRPLSFLAALALLTRLPALAPSAAPLPEVRGLLQRPAEEELDARVEEAKRSHAAKQEVARELAGGGLSLEEAAARFDAIDAGRSGALPAPGPGE